MAEQFRLTPEEVTSLRDAQSQINAARDTIKRLKAIGIPADDLEERLESAVKIRDGLLQHFSPTGVPKK